MLKRFVYMSVAFCLPLVAGAANMDAINNKAWGENVGWISFEQADVADEDLIGHAYGSNIGWITLNCSNNDSCDSAEFGIANDASGNLSGYAWGENIGWLDFENVSIDAEGDFGGYAYSPNIGYVSFNCSNTNTCDDVNFKVSTLWRKATVSEPVPTIEEPEEESSSVKSGKSGSRKRTVVSGEVLGVTIDGPASGQPSSSMSDENRLSTLAYDLYYGMTDANVKKLQQLLNKLGYILAQDGPGSPGNETEYFGALTKNALAKFQAEHSVAPTAGYFGPKTKAALSLLGF